MVPKYRDWIQVEPYLETMLEPRATQVEPEPKLDFQVENEPHATVITVKKTTLREVSLQP